jgi:hypothetical protein
MVNKRLGKTDYRFIEPECFEGSNFHNSRQKKRQKPQNLQFWVRFTFIGKESGTAIPSTMLRTGLAVFSRAGSPCHVVENNLPTKMNRILQFCRFYFKLAVL